MKRLFSLFLILCLIAVCSACSKDEKPTAESSASVEAQAADSAPAQETAGPAARLEGNGYDSPEEAVLAYVEAMNRGDACGMLSTFAIESFTAHSDPVLCMERNRNFTPAGLVQIPLTDDYSRSLIAQARFGELARQIQYSYASYAMEHMPSNRIQTYDDIRTLEDQFRQSPLCNMAGSVSFVQWLNPVILVGRGDILLRSAGDTMSSLAYAGGENLAELVAHIRIGETDACIGMQCIQYDGRWYNLFFESTALQFAGVKDVWNYNLWIPSDEMKDLYSQAAGSLPEEAAIWDALQKSDIAGTRWPLESLSLPDVTVYDSMEAVQSADGSGIWADIQFTRLGGGIITIAATPALQEVLGMDDATARITFPWYPGTIVTSYLSQNNGREIPLIRALHKEDIGIGFDGLNVEMNDSRVTFTLADGTTAVFRRPDAVPAAGSAAAEKAVAGPLEGSGYASAEDAVTAYIDAMDRGDVREMLSTFAIETYAAHADAEQYLQRIKTVNLKVNPASVPVVDEYGRSLLVCARYGELAYDLVSSYVWNTTGSLENVKFKSTAEARDFAERFRQSLMDGPEGHISFVRWIDPFIVSGGGFLKNGASILDTAVMAGADDVLDLTAEILLNGQTAYVGMRCALYDGRWYNLTPGSIFLISRAKNAATEASLYLPTDEDKAEIDRAMEQPDPEADTMWESIRKSSAGGTRWALVSLSNPDITVCAAEADAKDADGMAVWAEMRFGRMGGGLISVAASPALQKIIGTGTEGFLQPIPFTWQPENSDGSGRIVFRDFLTSSGMNISVSSVAATVTQDDTTVTFTLADGTEATFRKPE